MKKKGFTLIELLAVVVILAIVVLIAIPALTKLIENAKFGATKDTVYGLFEAAEFYYMMNDNEVEDGEITFTCDGEKCITPSGGKLKFKGKVPQSGSITVSNKEASADFLKIDDYCLLGNRNSLDVTKKKCTQEPGLYDDNNKLLASWDDLVNKYNLDVEQSYYKWDSDSYVQNGKDGKYAMYYLLKKYPEFKNATRVVISDTISVIGDYAFKNCSQLKSIIFLGGIKTIHYQSFKNCTGLVSIIWPKNEFYIDREAFWGCKSLKKLYIPANLTTIMWNTFYECPGLEKIIVDKNHKKYEDEGQNCIIDKSTKKLIKGTKNTIIPNDIEIIGEGAFFGGGSPKNVNIPGSVKTIQSNAFYNCQGLETVFIPDSVTKMYNGVFSYSSDLKNVRFSESISSVPESTFLGCKSLKKIDLPDNILKIEDSAFNGCSSLNDVKWPKDLNEIDRNAFSNCGFTEINIPDSVTNLGVYSFSNNNKLEKINIGKGVSLIKYSVFLRNPNIKNITVNKDNPNYEDRDSNAIIEKNSNKMILGAINTRIPNSVTTIGQYAFGYRNIKNIEIPNSITQIEASAFNSSKIERIDIPDSVTTIGIYAFAETPLIEIHLSNNLTEISKGLFDECSKLEYVDVPSSVKIIKELAFHRTGLNNFNIKLNEGLEEIEKTAFWTPGINKIKKITIPASAKKIGRSIVNTWKGEIIFKDPTNWNSIDNNGNIVTENVDLSDGKNNTNILSTYTLVKQS